MNSALLRSLAAGFAGLVGYGAWAVYANYDHGSDIAIRAGLVQGSYSFILTFVMTYVTEGLYEKLSPGALAIPATVTIVSVVLFSTAYGIHMWVGTPEILMTIFPGFVIGAIYTTVYVMGLRRQTTAQSKFPSQSVGSER